MNKSKEQENQEIGNKDSIPKSADLALEYVLWLLEREGIKFKQGKTALYWNLIHIIMKHVEDE